MPHNGQTSMSRRGHNGNSPFASPYAADSVTSPDAHKPAWEVMGLRYFLQSCNKIVHPCLAVGE